MLSALVAVSSLILPNFTPVPASLVRVQPLAMVERDEQGYIKEEALGDWTKLKKSTALGATVTEVNGTHVLLGGDAAEERDDLGGDGRGNSGLKCFRVSYFGVLRRPGELNRSESSEAWPPRSPFARNCSRKFSLPRSMAQLVELC